MASDIHSIAIRTRRQTLDELPGPRGMPTAVRIISTLQVKERDTRPDGLLPCEIVDCIYPGEPVAVEVTQVTGQGRDFTLHHRNGDRNDHSLENLGSAHRGCNAHEYAMRRAKGARPAAPQAGPLGRREGYSRARILPLPNSPPLSHPLAQAPAKPSTARYTDEDGNPAVSSILDRSDWIRQEGLTAARRILKEHGRVPLRDLASAVAGMIGCHYRTTRTYLRDWSNPYNLERFMDLDRDADGTEYVRLRCEEGEP